MPAPQDLRLDLCEWKGINTLDVVSPALDTGFGCGVAIKSSEELARFVLGVAEVLLVL